MADPIPASKTPTILVIAACLAGVTYLESALLEYPSHWLGTAGALGVLAALGAIQLLLAGLLYRRVRRNDDGYSVFFRRTALVVLAAFVALTAVILVPQGVALVSRDIHGAASLGALARAARA